MAHEYELRGTVKEVSSETFFVSVHINCEEKFLLCDQDKLFVHGIRCNGKVENVLEVSSEVTVYVRSELSGDFNVIAAWIGETPEFFEIEHKCLRALYGKTGSVITALEDDSVIILSLESGEGILARKRVLFSDGFQLEKGEEVEIDKCVTFDAVPLKSEHPSGALYMASCAWFGEKEPRIVDRFLLHEPVNRNRKCGALQETRFENTDVEVIDLDSGVKDCLQETSWKIYDEDIAILECNVTENVQVTGVKSESNDEEAEIIFESNKNGHQVKTERVVSLEEDMEMLEGDVEESVHVKTEKDVTDEDVEMLDKNVEECVKKEGSISTGEEVEILDCNSRTAVEDSKNVEVLDKYVVGTVSVIPNGILAFVDVRIDDVDEKVMLFRQSFDKCCSSIQEVVSVGDSLCLQLRSAKLLGKRRHWFVVKACKGRSDPESRLAEQNESTVVESKKEAENADLPAMKSIAIKPLEKRDSSFLLRTILNGCGRLERNGDFFVVNLKNFPVRVLILGAFYIRGKKVSRGEFVRQIGKVISFDATPLKNTEHLSGASYKAVFSWQGERPSYQTVLDKYCSASKNAAFRPDVVYVGMVSEIPLPDCCVVKFDSVPVLVPAKSLLVDPWTKDASPVVIADYLRFGDHVALTCKQEGDGFVARRCGTLPSFESLFGPIGIFDEESVSFVCNNINVDPPEAENRLIYLLRHDLNTHDRLEEDVPYKGIVAELPFRNYAVATIGEFRVLVHINSVVIVNQEKIEEDYDCISKHLVLGSTVLIWVLPKMFKDHSYYLAKEVRIISDASVRNKLVLKNFRGYVYSVKPRVTLRLLEQPYVVRLYDYERCFKCYFHYFRVGFNRSCCNSGYKAIGEARHKLIDGNHIKLSVVISKSKLALEDVAAVWLV